MTDDLARYAAAAAAALHDEARAALRARLRRLGRRATPGEALDAARRTLAEHLGPLADLLADATLAAWLAGAAAAAAGLPADPSAGPSAGPSADPSADVTSLPPPGAGPGGGPLAWDWDGSPAWLPLIEAAAADLRGRGLVTRDDWLRLSDEARGRAFTAAGLATEEALGAVRDALADAVAAGGGLRDFEDAVTDALGTSALGPGRLENVFRTDTARAYSRGLDEVLDHPAVADQFPFEETVPVRDSRLTELCDVASRSGIEGTGIYLRDDPEWRRLRPPRHWQCRCTRVPHTVESAAARGLRYARLWLRLGRQPLPAPHVPRVPVELPPGWHAGG